MAITLYNAVAMGYNERGKRIAQRIRGGSPLRVPGILPDG